MHFDVGESRHWQTNIAAENLILLFCRHISQKKNDLQ
jgi:hypothetical protein